MALDTSNSSNLEQLALKGLSVVLSTVLRSKTSNCVKEVAKIKQRRVERRAAQTAMREQHIQEYDVSAPSWEFEAMIRYSSFDSISRLYNVPQIS